MTQSIKEQQKRVTKTLKSLHDLLKQQKKISTRAEFLSFVDKAISENSLVRDFLSSGGRMGAFEADLKEIFDSKKNPYTKDAGKEKARTDIIHAKEQRDNIYIDSKFSNTVGQTTMYMTQYFTPGVCSDLFHGFVRLSMPIECDGVPPHPEGGSVPNTCCPEDVPAVVPAAPAAPAAPADGNEVPPQADLPEAGSDPNPSAY